MFLFANAALPFNIHKPAVRDFESSDHPRQIFRRTRNQLGWNQRPPFLGILATSVSTNGGFCLSLPSGKLANCT